MLYQIHWQDRDDLRKTEFVAQGEIKDEDSFLKTWAFFQEAMIRSLQNGNRPGGQLGSTHDRRKPRKLFTGSFPNRNFK